jgi:hypothetical protein
VGLSHGAQEPLGVRDGLVVYLDAANARSYPRSGPTWFDRSGNDINGNLVNSPTFLTEYFGAISLDGTDERINFSNSNNYYAETVIVWAKSNTATWSGSGAGGGFGYLSSSRRKNGHVLHTNAGNTSVSVFVMLTDADSNFNSYYSPGTISPSNIQIPHMYAYSTNGLDLHKGYLDGVAVATSTTEISRDVNTVQRYWEVGSDDFPPQARNGNGTYYVLQKYNRQLTDAEIQQNFNALRSRFSI